MTAQLNWRCSRFSPTDEEEISVPLPVALAKASARWPDRVAILHEDEQLTFSNLASRASGLASQIKAAVASPGPVALVQSAVPDFVAAWFAPAICGRQFLLLEPGHPPRRLRELIEAAGAAAVVCDPCSAPGADSALSNLPIRKIMPRRLMLPEQPISGLKADEPSMIFPTSGSTGQPKLVTYSDQTLLAKVMASVRLMRIDENSRVVIAGSHGNYGFLHHALVFLLSGGSLCLADVRKGGFHAVIDAVERLGARQARFTPSMFRTFARMPEARDALQALVAVRFSGEPLLISDLKLAQSVLSPGCLVQNVYGSTESALFIWTIGDFVEWKAATVPIGHIYPGSSFALKPCLESGEAGTGELLIRSSDHALGDLRAGVIRTDRFTRIPSGTGESEYSTGDLVRELGDGSLLLLGRTDRMVKVRGQRVFLSEVENHLLKLPGVTGAAVIASDDGSGSSLHGFMTVADFDKAGDARKWLSASLPDYMIPSRIETVEELPMLPGGKVDAASLRERLRSNGIAAGTDMRGSRDNIIREIWTSILGNGAESPENDFFTLGGDSLKLMRMAFEVEKHFGIKISGEDFLADPTLSGLARIAGVLPVPAAGHTGIAGARHGRTGLRQVLKGKEPSLGAAFAMPGWRGSAPVFPFTQAGLLTEYDIWAADMKLGRGSILTDGLWWRTAVDIANQLRSGNFPRPRILFGYSVGGSIAWLVGRLLAGSPFCPDQVLMFDSAPLHRLSPYREPELEEAILSQKGRPPVTFLVHRASLAHVGIQLGHANRWHEQDNVRSAACVPTVDHDDLLRPDLLSSVAGCISHTLSATEGPEDPQSISHPEVQTLGTRAHALLSQGDSRDQLELDDLIREMSSTPGWEVSPGLLYLILRDATRDQAKAILELIIRRHPASRLMRYAHYRCNRNPKSLCPDRKPSLITQGFLGLRAIENALATHQAIIRTSTQTIVSRGLQALDLLNAAASARQSR